MKVKTCLAKSFENIIFNKAFWSLKKCNFIEWSLFCFFSEEAKQHWITYYSQKFGWIFHKIYFKPSLIFHIPWLPLRFLFNQHSQFGPLEMHWAIMAMLFYWLILIAFQKWEEFEIFAAMIFLRSKPGCIILPMTNKAKQRW